MSDMSDAVFLHFVSMMVKIVALGVACCFIGVLEEFLNKKFGVHIPFIPNDNHKLAHQLIFNLGGAAIAVIFILLFF